MRSAVPHGSNEYIWGLMVLARLRRAFSQLVRVYPALQGFRPFVDEVLGNVCVTTGLFCVRLSYIYRMRIIKHLTRSPNTDSWSRTGARPLKDNSSPVHVISTAIGKRISSHRSCELQTPDLLLHAATCGYAVEYAQYQEE